jgi:hypothetical protein
LRTHTHLLHRSCHCWKHRQKASFGIFCSSVVAFHSISSIVAKRVPLRPIFGVGNSQKSLGARSGEYGSWVMTGMLSRRGIAVITTSDVWLGATHVVVLCAALLFHVPHCCFMCHAVALCATQLLYMPHSCFMCHTVVLCATQLFYVPHSFYMCHTVVLCATQLLYVPHSCYICHTVVIYATQLFYVPHSCYMCHTVVPIWAAFLCRYPLLHP